MEKPTFWQNLWGIVFGSTQKQSKKPSLKTEEFNNINNVDPPKSNAFATVAAQSGRQTKDPAYFYDGQTVISRFKEFLPKLVGHSIIHHDFSYAVSNLMNLGSTNLEFKIDSNIAGQSKKKMLAIIDEANKRWYAGNGINALTSALLRQIAITGALSIEGYPEAKANPKIIEDIVKVNPDSIYFEYRGGKYVPYQQIIGQNTLFLNPNTYRYIGLSTTDDSPEGIPPFIASLALLDIEKDMISNFSAIAKRLGMFGFLEVLLPVDDNNYGVKESDYVVYEDFQAAVQAKANDVATRTANNIDGTLNKGYVIGFNGQHKFQMSGNPSNADVAAKMKEILDFMTMASLKTNGGLQGRTTATTETFGRVFLQMLLSQVTTMQDAITRVYEHFHRLNLMLSGFDSKYYNAVKVKLTQPMLGDELKDIQTKSIKQQLAIQRRNEGIIDQDTLAQELGYDKAALPTPLIPSNPNINDSSAGGDNKTNPAGKLAKNGFDFSEFMN